MKFVMSASSGINVCVRVRAPVQVRTRAPVRICAHDNVRVHAYVSVHSQGWAPGL